MTPRPYALGKRAETAEATRRRILESAADLYRERGVRATTLRLVGERADVSRGTVLHHFGTADGLLAAVLDFIVRALELPDADALEGIEDRDARIRVFVNAMIDFQARSTDWWTTFDGEMHRPLLQEKEAQYWEVLGRLQAAALGPRLGQDPLANAALLGIIHPATVGTFNWAFERAGLDRDEARPVLAELAVDAVRRIADRTTEGGGSS